MLLGDVKVGDFVETHDWMDLTFYFQERLTGYPKVQTCCPHRMLWRVAEQSDYAKTQLVSAKSMMSLTLAGKTGYERAVDIVMDVAEKIFVSRRCRDDSEESSCSIRVLGGYRKPNGFAELSYALSPYGFSHEGMVDDIIMLSNANLIPDVDFLWIPRSNFVEFDGKKMYNVSVFDVKKGVVNVKTLYSEDANGEKMGYTGTADIIAILSTPTHLEISGGSGSESDPYKLIW